MIKVLMGVGFVGLLLAYLFWPRRMPLPDEANRVVVPGHFSIIAPAGWESSVTAGDGVFDRELMLRPPGVGRREPSLRVRRYREKPELEPLLTKGYVSAELAGQPVWVHQRSTRIEYLWILLLEREGGWFEITLSTPISVDFAASDWRAYVESFRAEKAAPPTPAVPTTTAAEVSS